MSLIYRLSLVTSVLLVATGVASAGEPVVQGLDHFPLAVKNLDRSKADFEMLGFVLKPGRPHADGVRNSHAKFPDGTEIELITATPVAGDIQSIYVDWLKQGDGPAPLLGLFAPDPTALKERLAQENLSVWKNHDFSTIVDPALGRLFFAQRQHAPSDRPEHFAHPNTAFSLAGIWLAGADAERRLLVLLGASPAPPTTCSPFDATADAYALPEARVSFLPATAHLISGRPIIGATVAVRNLQAVREIATTNHIAFVQPAGCEGHSLWVGPRVAHGLWLEFRQP